MGKTTKHRPDPTPIGDHNYTGLPPQPQITVEYLERMKKDNDNNNWHANLLSMARPVDILRGVIVHRL